jgi:hypothetical protein
MVEGPTSARRKNMGHHTIKIAKHITSSNPKHLKSGSAQSAITDGVAFRIAPHRMCLAIDLDCEPVLQTSEVDHITTTRELSTKSQSLGTLAQLLPQGNFR